MLKKAKGISNVTWIKRAGCDEKLRGDNYARESREQGVSLLEVMLVLVVIGLLIIVSVRYFGSANATKNRAAAIAQMNAIFNASKAYINASGASATLLSAAGGGALVDGNYLTQADTLNPWRGNVSACWGTSNCSGNKDATNLQIVMYGVPEEDCATILTSISSSTVSADNSCVNADNAQTLTVYYQLF